MRREHRTRGTHPGRPGWVWIPAGLGIIFLLLPILGLASRVEFVHLGDILIDPESRAAMGLSLLTSVLAMLVSVLVGFPLGYVLATGHFRGQRAMRTLILLPLVLPPVVSGLALLYTFGRSAPLGALLENSGLGLAYTTAAVILAQSFVSMPFMVMSIETAVRSARIRDYELAAAELGASPSRVFLAVTLPLLRPAILTGAVLCFARSLGEFGATLTFAGSLSGITRTMPLQIYLVRESDPAAAITLSLVLVVVALVIIILAYRSPHAPRLRHAVTRIDGGHPETPDMSTESTPQQSRRRRRTTAHSQGDSATQLRLIARSTGRGLDIDLAVPTGTTVAIIGRNGAGKSSTFSILTGALSADRARLQIEGRTLVDYGERGSRLDPPIHSRGIVHLAQNPLLFPHLSVIGNVMFGLRARGVSAAEARRRSQRMLTDLGVGQCAARRSHEVSGGQAARIALARALVVDPQLLLLDEPLAALDVDVAAATRTLLSTALRSRTVLLITHDPADVAELAEELILIDEGTAVSVGAVGRLEPERVGAGREFLTSFCAGRENDLMWDASQ